MIGKSPNRMEQELFRPLLSDFIDMDHELVLLSEKIDWTYFEREFAPLYSKRGGRGPKEVRGVQVITPGTPLKKDSTYDRRKKRHPFRRRAGIEPLIGHLKYDHRMLENYLWGRSPERSMRCWPPPRGTSRN